MLLTGRMNELPTFILENFSLEEGAMIAAVIPCRMNSTRFYGKPLAMVDGMPMVMHPFLSLAQTEQSRRVKLASAIWTIRSGNRSM